MKALTGTIISLIDKASAVVSVESKFKHPIYKKQIKKTKKFSIHLPKGAKPKLGDRVTIQETRPVSKTKKFILVTNKTVS